MLIVLLLIIILIVAAESSAMFSIKKSLQTSPSMYYAMGVLFYSLVCVLLRESFKYDKIGVINGLWSAFSVISAIMVGKVFYGEDLTRMEALAIAMATVAAIILAQHTEVDDARTVSGPKT